MPGWRDELIEAVKSKAEREEEERARQRKRVEEALSSAESAFQLGTESLGFAAEQLRTKNQTIELRATKNQHILVFSNFSLSIEFVRDAAIVRIVMCDSKPRDFDFAKDRHIAPADVEEYVGRRALELVRAAQNSSPW